MLRSEWFEECSSKVALHTAVCVPFGCQEIVENKRKHTVSLCLLWKTVCVCTIDNCIWRSTRHFLRPNGILYVKHMIVF